MSSHNCKVCGSESVRSFNSYKHICFACSDCNSVFHVKKSGRYLLEYLFPVKLLSRILPRQVSHRLFHADSKFEPSEFYDSYVNECENVSLHRKSEYDQLVDQFACAGIDLCGKRIIDISGGPGYVGYKLGQIADEVVVTEFSNESVRAMRDVFDVNAVTFNYAEDDLGSLFDKKYDIVLIRSSIIFCENLDLLINQARAVLEEGGYILVESILPTLGEVFWWQQMEFKFPVIYSQEAIEKFFYKNGFSLVFAYRDSGSYTKNKWRGARSFGHRLFTWLVDFPMMLLYFLFSRKSRIPIDQSTNHKMITQIWKMNDVVCASSNVQYINYRDKRSTHFSFIYDGYLKENVK